MGRKMRFCRRGIGRGARSRLFHRLPHIDHRRDQSHIRSTTVLIYYKYCLNYTSHNFLASHPPSRVTYPDLPSPPYPSCRAFLYSKTRDFHHTLFQTDATQRARRTLAARISKRKQRKGELRTARMRKERKKHFFDHRLRTRTSTSDSNKGKEQTKQYIKKAHGERIEKLIETIKRKRKEHDIPYSPPPSETQPLSPAPPSTLIDFTSPFCTWSFCIWVRLLLPPSHPSTPSRSIPQGNSVSKPRPS